MGEGMARSQFTRLSLTLTGAGTLAGAGTLPAATDGTATSTFPEQTSENHHFDLGEDFGSRHTADSLIPVDPLRTFPMMA